MNSVLQPATSTDAPVVGVALTAEVAVPGSATGASHPGDIELAVRFCLEVAKAFGQGRCRFYEVVVRMRGPATFDPALEPMYGIPACTRTRMASRSLACRRRFSSA